MKDYLAMVFSFKGRIGRIDFLLGHFGLIFIIPMVLVTAMLAISFIFYIANIHVDYLPYACGIALLVGAAGTISLAVKRLRDIGLDNISVYILAPLSLVPIIALLLFIPLFFFKADMV